jgi:hypothetical protein
MIARLDAANALVNFFNNPRRFMTGHNRQIPAPIPFQEMNIAVANGCRRQANFHLTELGWINLHVFNH